MTRRQFKAFFAYLLIFPAVGFLLFIVAVPLIETIRLSFTNASLRPTYEYIGFQNYTKIFSRNFHQVIGLTFLWMFLGVGLKMVIGTLGALLLNASLRGTTLFRILLMPPWVVPIAIGIIGWTWLYQGNFGLISGTLQNLGILDGPYEFLGHRVSAFWSVMVTDVWIGTPMVTLFLLAAMQGVPKDLYEAAWVDGASRWHRFWEITIPQIAPVLSSMSILSAIWTFNSFEPIWILTKGGPGKATTTMIIDMFKVGLRRFKYGEGSARAVVIVLILSSFIFLYFQLLKYLANRDSGVQK